MDVAFLKSIFLTLLLVGSGTGLYIQAASAGEKEELQYQNLTLKFQIKTMEIQLIQKDFQELKKVMEAQGYKFDEAGNVIRPAEKKEEPKK